MKKSQYTLKFYQGRKLIAEHTWDANESFLDDITHDAENLITEGVECNPPEIPKDKDQGLPPSGGDIRTDRRDA